MKTGTKFRVGKTAGFALAAVMALSAIPAGVLSAHAYRSEDVTTGAEDNVYTSNLIKDGTFENLTLENNADGKPVKAGAWDIDVTSTSAGQGGQVTLVEDEGAVGGSAIRLKSSSRYSGYPEISQKMTVLPNTTYYVEMKVRIGYTNAIFFGIASENRAGEKIYGQVHRWDGFDIDVDHNDEENRLTVGSDKFSGYTLYTGYFTTGDETNVRLFVRQEKSDMIIDDVSVSWAGDLMPIGAANLLKNGGFEDGKDVGWQELSKSDNAAEVGIDAMSTTTFSVTTQDKQMEGLNTLYIAAKNSFGTEDHYTIGQPVTVTANTNYTFAANLSKFAEATVMAAEDVRALGIQKVTMGIGYYTTDDEGNEVFANIGRGKVINGADISSACFQRFTYMANSGEHTAVYPYVKFEATVGNADQYGNCLYIDGCSFYENKIDLPAETENMILNGNLAGNGDIWLQVGGSSQLGYQSSSSYLTGSGSVWLSQWNPYNGLMQSVSLKAGKYYRVTAYLQGYLNGPADAPFDDLNSPANILIIKGHDEDVESTVNAAQSSWAYGDSFVLPAIDDNVVARQTVDLDTSAGYRPVTVIFSVPEDGEYTVFVGFEGWAYYSETDSWIWRGGMNIGGVAMYEMSESELKPVKVWKVTELLGNADTKNITLGESAITVAKNTPVSHFKENVYGYGYGNTDEETYAYKIVDANGAEVTTGNIAAGSKLVVSGAEGFTPVEFALTVSDTAFVADNNGSNGDNNNDNNNNGDDNKSGGGCGSAIGIGTGAMLVTLLAGTVAVVRKKKD